MTLPWRIAGFLLFALLSFGVSAFGWSRLYDKGGFLSVALIVMGCACGVGGILFLVFAR